MFRAVQVIKHGGPEVMEIIERTTLPLIKENEILVRIYAAAVNPVDTYIREGWHTASRTCPYTPGLDCAGDVISVGAKIDTFHVGDRVFSCGSVSGTYATHGVFKADQLFSLPQTMSYKAGACFGTGYLTSLYAIQCTHPIHSQYIFVHGGSGGVGSSIIKILLSMKKTMADCEDLHIAASCGTTRSEEYLRQLGVDCVVNHNKSNYMDEVKNENGGKGPDIIYEMLANVNLKKDMEVLNHRGEILVIGNRGTIEINPRDMMVKGLSIHGVMLFNQTSKERNNSILLLDKLCADCPAIMNPLIDKEYPLDEAKEAHIDVIEHKNGAFGRILVDPSL